ncbi:DNA polymerase III subunit beta [Candidatus Gottesmanbacteria bacterium CG11_big_fil_rev_8_21_14_0_20_37_11]|uniref:Beta sliding clamp n=1 Tax=Candidatus Gottesmanbacteria bacterium CG11_big_fil_rev_8_21_14_0_20_37_11 TaxID=1974575 RepID=A0A2H0NIR5_9BACT|nr:MAG: DNA polymerase III subunit beta [Candidatus Gottesmanbacteria bacterium CG23_combo_of_CG06-09_8_20_14_all_37_19]PIR08076.1 MAG: DNA polymerase III subunit beta [Candidatus Gottesmanbacteria bacterium CG11_big_fil_rev_8_21_14_0_20_37_11]
MHVIVLKENLGKALSIVGKIVSIRPQLPILSNILLKAENHKLLLKATNLEIGMIYEVAAKIEKEGETTVPGKLITDFINTLNSDKIEIILDDKKLIIKTNKSHASFSITNPTDFPTFPSLTDQKKSLPIEKLKGAIIRTVFAASIDESRPVLTGVKTIIKNGKISLSATDGYRLSMDYIEIPDKKEDLNVILPATSLLEVVRAAQETKNEEVIFNIIENKNQVVFTLPNISIYTRLIDGEFPNIEKIIPQGFKTKVTINKEEFTRSVKTASLFARNAANIIKVKIEKQGIRLSANTPQIGENEDFIEAKVEGEVIETAFNYRFLLDLLANFPDDNVVFESSGSLSPGVFKPEKTNLSFLHLIMPVRIQE